MIHIFCMVLLTALSYESFANEIKNTNAKDAVEIEVKRTVAKTILISFLSLLNIFPPVYLLFLIKINLNLRVNKRVLESF